MDIVTPEEAYNHVFKAQYPSDHPQDELDALGMLVSGISETIQSYLGGPLFVTSYTEKHDGGRSRLFLRHRPVYAVTAVRELQVPLIQNVDYYLYKDEGYLLRSVGGGVLWWGRGSPVRPELSLGINWADWPVMPQAIEVEYQAGLAMNTADVPADIKLAALIWILDIWATGPANMSNLVSDHRMIIHPTRIPPQVTELLGRRMQSRVVVG